MKLPAVWVAAAFAVGLGLAGPDSPLAFILPMVWLALVAAALLAVVALLRRSALCSAGVAALIAWIFLGALAIRLDEVARPPHHVTRLMAQGVVPLGESLRWRGRLREDPVRLGWGERYEMELEQVEIAGKVQPLAGGLRINHFRNPRAPEAPLELRAGDRVEALVRARPPHNYGNRGAFDFRGYLARQNIHLLASLRSNELLQRVDQPAPTLGHRLAHLRGRLLDRVDALFASAPDRAAVLRAMLLGDRSFVEHERVEAFQKAATYHVLVIAGLHVAALTAFVLWACRRLRLSLVGSTLVALTVLASYVAIVEDRPPILRAALMATVYLLARLLYRRVDLLQTAALAALAILVARPSALTDASFQLSFLAIGTIGALAVPWIERSSERYRRALDHLEDPTRDAAHDPRATQFRLDARAAATWLGSHLPARVSDRAAAVVGLPCRTAFRVWEIVLISFVLQVGMLPLLAHYFHRISLSGPAANIPAVLLTGLIVPVGFLVLTVSLAWNWLGNALATLLGALVAALVHSVEWFAQMNWASYRIPGPPAWLLATFFATTVLLAFAARTARRRWENLARALLMVLVLTIATYPFPSSIPRGKLEVTVLDVGQGDSILAAFPDGRTMLVDGGGVAAPGRISGMRTGIAVGEDVVSPYLWSRGLKRLDVVALSHAHYDHLEGLDAVLKNFRVRELWVGRDVDTAAFRALVQAARERGTAVVHKIHGDAFQWDGVTGRVSWPLTTEEVNAGKNDDSIVLRLQFGRVGMLLPGDIELPVERELVAERALLAADFLKVPHHGSKTSTTSDFLNDVAPQVAAISAGEGNPFGHPHAEALDRLRAAHVRVYRTDRDGAITALSDGQSLRVSTFLGLASSAPR